MYVYIPYVQESREQHEHDKRRGKQGGGTQFRFLEMKNTVCKMKNLTANQSLKKKRLVNSKTLMETIQNKNADRKKPSK